MSYKHQISGRCAPWIKDSVGNATAFGITGVQAIEQDVKHWNTGGVRWSTVARGGQVIGETTELAKEGYRHFGPGMYDLSRPTTSSYTAPFDGPARFSHSAACRLRTEVECNPNISPGCYTNEEQSSSFRRPSKNVKVESGDACFLSSKNSPRLQTCHVDKETFSVASHYDAEWDKQAWSGHSRSGWSTEERGLLEDAPEQLVSSGARYFLEHEKTPLTKRLASIHAVGDVKPRKKSTNVSLSQIPRFTALVGAQSSEIDRDPDFGPGRYKIACDTIAGRTKPDKHGRSCAAMGSQTERFPRSESVKYGICQAKPYFAMGDRRLKAQKGHDMKAEEAQRRQKEERRLRQIHYDSF